PHPLPVGPGLQPVAARRARGDRRSVDLRHPPADGSHDARRRSAPAAGGPLLPAPGRLLRLRLGAHRRRLPGSMSRAAPRRSLFRAALTAPGGLALGTWVKLPAMESVELLALAGFDFVVIDLEHSAMNLESVYRHIGTALL